MKNIIKIIVIIILVMVLAFIMLVSSMALQVRESMQSEASSVSKLLPPTSNEVETAINEWRVDQGLAAFNSEVPALDKAAQARAEGMCAENDWSHAKDWQVLDQYYTYSYAGENLYYGNLQPNQDDDAVKTWAASPSHLTNLQADYSQIGIGVKSCPGFQGNDTAVIITNYFGVPR